VNDELEALTAAVFRQTSFIGLGSLEVKYDHAGKPWITEPTVGRPNLQSYSAFAQGENIYARALEQALGVTLRARISRRRNVVWVQEWYLLQIAAGRNGEPIPWRLILRALLTVRWISGAYGAWWDPAPAAHLLKSLLAQAWRSVRGA